MGLQGDQKKISAGVSGLVKKTLDCSAHANVHCACHSISFHNHPFYIQSTFVIFDNPCCQDLCTINSLKIHICDGSNQYSSSLEKHDLSWEESVGFSCPIKLVITKDKHNNILHLKMAAYYKYMVNIYILVLVFTKQNVYLITH